MPSGMMLTAINWNIDPEIVSVFGFSLRYYSLFFVGGLMLCIHVLHGIYQRENLPEEDLEKLSVYALLGIVIGARLGHCLFYEPSYYLANPLEMILPIAFLPDGGIQFIGYRGLASHGGALGLLIGVYLYSRKTQHSLLKVFDLIGIVAALACGFIRIGNFMNSEIIGLPTGTDWGVIFARIDDLPRHPAQLYEAFAYLLIFLVIIALYKARKYRLAGGFYFGLVLVLCSSARFFIEFVKENQVSFEDQMALNMGQLLSLPYILLGVGLIVYSFKKEEDLTTDQSYSH
ncbi:MAG: prolipoprotein diacylglyceryl transferase [Bacteroidota bacterium]